jgi:hypothetical protein
MLATGSSLYQRNKIALKQVSRAPDRIGDFSHAVLGPDHLISSCSTDAIDHVSPNQAK